MADGFLGRWSRRKLDARDGRPQEDAPPPPPAVLQKSDANPGVLSGAPVGTAITSGPSGAANPGGEPPSEAAQADTAPAPAPTLADAQALTPESDFKPFMRGGVAPEVKNAAMRKLFADPHFNVMDRLDTYIDDYSISEPIPPAMLRQLASAQFLGFFRDEEEKEAKARAKAQADASAAANEPPAVVVEPREVANNLALDSMAQLPHDHHPDLRLQPDHATPGQEPGRGT